MPLTDVDLARARRRELRPLLGGELLADEGGAVRVREQGSRVVDDDCAGAVPDRGGG